MAFASNNSNKESAITSGSTHDRTRVPNAPFGRVSRVGRLTARSFAKRKSPILGDGLMRRVADNLPEIKNLNTRESIKETIFLALI
jgi:hypothetical protein